MTKRKIEYWVIPPEQDAEFVAAMEDVLELDAKAYDASHPVLCMDEKPLQLLKETQVPIAATKTHAKRVDTHTKGAFYEVFEPAKARAYVKRLDFHYTPKHGSWLNVAECELSCLEKQCLSHRRIGELTDLQSEIREWSNRTNAKQRGVDWQFRIEDARVKFKRLYPTIKV